MDIQGHVKIDRNGRALVIGGALKRSLSHQAGFYTLTETDSRQLMLTRSTQIPKFGELSEPIIFQGDLAGIGSTVEIVHFVISTRLNGQLTLVQGEVRKSLFFHEGNLCAARSNHPDDRLSEVLDRYGALERDVINQAEEACFHSGQPLGNYLLQRGELTQGQLYLFFKKQVEEIFYSVLDYLSGEFYFTAPLKNDTPTPLKLNAQQLLLEGVKRTDEMKRYCEVFPSPETLIVRKEGDVLSLTEELSAILAHLEHPRSLKELVSFFRVGELTLYQRVFKLHELRLVDVQPSEDHQRQKVSEDEMIMLFNRTFGMIARFGEEHGVPDVLTISLDTFKQLYFEEGLFDGVNFDERGRLNQTQLLENLSDLHREDKLNFMGHSLCELLYFCTFAARDWLSAEESNQLQDVYEQLSLLIVD